MGVEPLNCTREGTGNYAPRAVKEVGFMRINITVRNMMTLSPSVANYVNKKVGQAGSLFWRRDRSAGPFEHGAPPLHL